MHAMIIRKHLLSSLARGKWKLLISRQLSSVKLHVSKKISLMDEAIVVSGSGFHPGQQITVRASVKSAADKINLQSLAHITANMEGNFDLSKNESVGGTYHGVNGMGLFWSMKEIEGKLTRFMPADVMMPYRFNFHVFDGYIDDFSNVRSMAHLEIDRCFYKPDVQRIPVEENGVYGTLFVPPGKGPFPGIVTIAAFSRKKGAETQIPAFANHGFATFLVLYMGEGTLPKSFSDIEIEYFEKAVNMFQAMDCVLDTGIGAYGRSQAGGIVLSMAAFLDCVQAVVSVNGSMGSIGIKTTYKDFCIPKIGTDITKARIDGFTLLNGGECIDNISGKPEKQIPIENSDADILMIVGEDDKCWNSRQYADIAIERMDRSRKSNLNVVSYPSAGHSIAYPYIPPRIYDYHGALPVGMVMDYGGQDIKKHVQAQVDAQKKVISFFKEKLT